MEITNEILLKRINETSKKSLDSVPFLKFHSGPYFIDSIIILNVIFDKNIDIPKNSWVFFFLIKN
jgi:hypothetical protein